MGEIDDLKHDIERHLAICSEQATRIAELEDALDTLHTQGLERAQGWMMVPKVEWDPVSAPHIRPPMEHELKTWPAFFKAIWDNEKHFELRKDDRGCQGGDTLLLREWSKGSGYSGRAVRAEVTYLLGGDWPGLTRGYVCMSIERREQFARYQQQ